MSAKNYAAMVVRISDLLRKTADLYRPAATFANTLERIKSLLAGLPFDEKVAAELNNLSEMFRHSEVIQFNAVVKRALENAEVLERMLIAQAEGRKISV